MLKGLSMHTPSAFEIRFQSLFHEGRALAFPCDSHGEVDLDAMGEKARNNYLFARGMIGREYAMPFVQARAAHAWSGNSVAVEKELEAL
ncbi:hypothetical protein QTI24_18350 [Variovorax sp. J22P240]|uniref:hypothetical protein n=1 Tax=Variovorax sp. J22P240 TaxID=3053514 RepID=UPI002577D591|nr:hypothetical protein [Variovorax sp. J22P240]MDM0000587.1 hypothetical protein [Variovorax sp. J22P240]